MRARIALLATMSLAAILLAVSAAFGLSNDPSSYSTVSTLNVAAYSFVLSPNGSTLYAADNVHNQIHIIDLATATVTASIPVTGGSAEMAISPDGSTLYVNGFANGTMVAVKTAAPYATTTYNTGSSTTDAAVLPNGSRVFATTGSGVSIVDPSQPGGAVQTISTGSAENSVAITPDGTRAYVAPWTGTPGLVVMNTATHAFTRITSPSLPTGAVHVEINRAGTRAYVINQPANNVAVVDTNPADAAAHTYNTVIATIPVGAGPFWGVLSPDGTRLYVTNSSAGTMSVIDTATNAVIATSAANYSQPAGLIVSPDGTRVYVANLSGGTITLTQAQVHASPIGITVNPGNGAATTTTKVPWGSSFPLPATPSRTGYTFAGWWSGTSRLTAAINPVTAPETLTGHWSINHEAVSFNTAGGSPVPAQSVAYGNTVKQPPPPTRTGYTFKGWYPTSSSTTTWNFATAITSPRTLYARWTPITEVVTLFNGTVVVGQPTVPYGGRVTLPTAPTQPGLSFTGWFTGITGGVLWPNPPVVADTSLWARWSPILEGVVFKVGSSTLVRRAVPYGQAVPLPTPARRTGYTFTGWSVQPTGGSRWLAASPITAPTTLYAQWARQKEAVTFDTGTGTTVPVARVLYGKTLTLPSPPTRRGFSFAGWYTAAAGGKEWPAGARVSTAMTLYAHWTPVKVTTKANTIRSTDDSRAISHQSTFRYVPSIWDIVKHPEHIGWALAVGMVWTLLLSMGTSVLDSAIRTRYAAFGSLIARVLPKQWRRRQGSLPLLERLPWTGLLSLLFLNAVILGFTDPHFGFDPLSGRMLASVLIAEAIIVLLPALISAGLARRKGVTTFIGGTPWGVAVCIAGVVLSRALRFLPGIFAGSVVRYEQDHASIPQKVNGTRTKMLITLGIGGLCWIASSSVHPDRAWWALCLKDSISAVTLMAFTGCLLDLVPLTYQSGGLLFHHARRSWTALCVVVLTVFLMVVVPQPNYWLYVGGRTTWWMIIAGVVVGIGLVIIAIAERAERRKAEREEHEVELERTAAD